MQLDGHTFEAPNEEVIVIPRPKKDIVFLATAVLDFDEFEQLCPEPDVPMRITPGKGKQLNFDDTGYVQAIGFRAEARMNYIFLKSIAATPGLKWETVDMGDPKTWGKYRSELKKCFFNETEILRIENGVFTANSLNEARVQEARENFLRGREEEQNDISGQSSEQSNTPSGQPAKD